MFKCLNCDERFNEIEDLYGHYEEEHVDSIPKNFTAAQYHYYLKTGKENGKCVVCKSNTKWNESTNKYHRFCDNPKCKEKYKEEFRSRMIGKHGKIHLLNDPDQQRKMLANRSISGKYKWSDSKEIPYTGTYELDFLKFLDIFMGFESDDIIAPSPHTYYYIYEGEEKFYIPDFFIPSLGLEIEVKDGGDNPNNHHKIQGVDKVKEKLKDAVMTSQKSFSYIKIINKKYDPFFDFMMQKKREFEEKGNIESPVFIVTESISTDSSKEPVVESIGDISLQEAENEKQVDVEIEEIFEMLSMMDQGLVIPEYHFDSQNLMENWDKGTRKAISKEYKYTDRFKIGFTVRNMDLIFSNMMKNAQKTGNFEGLRKNLLNLINRCANVSEVNYLRRDKNAGKIMLKKLAINKPMLADECHSHIKWLETEYTEALNARAKELREKGKNAIKENNSFTL